MMNRLMRTTAMTIAAGALAFSAQAADVDPTADKYKNDSPITITGVVSDTGEDSFELRYGDGETIKIEMDDWDWIDESEPIEAGDRVTVYGDIDHDLFETRKIEANSVYSHNRSAYYFASDADEEDVYKQYTYTPLIVNVETVPDDNKLSLTGTVGDIDDREFTLIMETGSIVIDTDEMDYNPLDDEGYQRLKVGDKVYVSGEMDRDFFEDKEIDAEQIVTLHKKWRKS